MTGSGGDAADRALDDALALANDRGGGDDRPRHPANDPLTVALGLGKPFPDPQGAQPPAPAGSSRPAPASAVPAERSDPLSVALGAGGTGLRPDPGPIGTPAPSTGQVPARAAAPAPAAAQDRGRAPGRAPDGARSRSRSRPEAVAPACAADPLDIALRHGEEDAGPPARAGEARGGTVPGAPGDLLLPGAPRPGSHPPGHEAYDGHRNGRHQHGGHGPGATWSEARRIARQAGRRLAPRIRPLGEEALGAALAGGLVALTDLPSFDSSAMDGWAVSGAGPWRLKGRLLAGQRSDEPLLDGHAARIATGALLPPGAEAVLRSEHGRTERRTDGEWLRPREQRFAPRPGQEVRRRGQECMLGDELLPAGTVVTPAVLGLAAAAGYDELTVTARPTVDVLVLGDELLSQGLPGDGRVRDALGPMLPSWLRSLGAEVLSVRRLVDDKEALREAITGATADLIITTGGTAGGPVDHVHPVLAGIGARLLVDGVAVRPGHPMLLAELPGRGGQQAGSGTANRAPNPSGSRGNPPGGPASGRGPFLIGLPGNPLAAVSGVLTLAAPLLGVLSGRRAPAPYAAPLTSDVTGHPVDTRLVPVVFDDESAARPLHYAGPAMLRGLAAADGVAVIPPGGMRAGQEAAVLDTGMLGPVWGTGG